MINNNPLNPDPLIPEEESFPKLVKVTWLPESKKHQQGRGTGLVEIAVLCLSCGKPVRIKAVALHFFDIVDFRTRAAHCDCGMQFYPQNVNAMQFKDFVGIEQGDFRQIFIEDRHKATGKGGSQNGKTRKKKTKGGIKELLRQAMGLGV